MNDGQITSLLHRDAAVSALFLGVFASDQLPKLPPRPSCLIANTDPASAPGKHWVAFFLEADGRGEFFDSYGRMPKLPSFNRFLAQNTADWIHNDTLLQGTLAVTCGQYCMYYLLYRCRGMPMHEIISHFDSTDRCENDTAVNEFLSSYFDVDLDAYNIDFVVHQISKMLQENE